MGCGKTTIARELSNILRHPYLDTDKEIQKQTNFTINEIFKNFDEIYFRKKEKEILTSIKGKKIVSTGGGLPIYSDNMKYIKKNGISIYLKTPIQILYNRLKNNLDNRPLINNIKNSHLKIFIKKQVQQREYYYKQANYIVETKDKSKKVILREIYSLISRC
tara:strand:- start:269 stop:754 length:486 start_codon:yes stop_codon:yes gene_type:complete